MNTNILLAASYITPTTVNLWYSISRLVHDWREDNTQPIHYRNVTLGYILLGMFFTFTPIIHLFYFVFVAAPGFFSSLFHRFEKILNTPLNRTKIPLDTFK